MENNEELYSKETHDYTQAKCISTLEGHIAGVSSLVNLSVDKFASSSWDKTIRIWQIKSNDNYECIQILTGHELSVTCILNFSNSILISGSDDRSIKIWENSEKENYQCVTTLKSH